MNQPRISGIYCISCTKNGKRYIGSSKDVFNRRRQHFQSLGKGNHHNPVLQRTYSKYPAHFVFGIVEECSESDLPSRELFYIRTLNTWCKNGAGFNIMEPDENERLTILPLEKRIEVNKRSYQTYCNTRPNLPSTLVHVAEIRNLYTNGLNFKEISELTGFSITPVSSICKNISKHWFDPAYKYISRNYQYIPEYQITRVAELLETRHSHKQITTLTGLGRYKILTCKQILKKHKSRSYHTVKNTLTGEVFSSVKAAADNIGIDNSGLLKKLTGKHINNTPFVLIQK